MTWQGGLTLAIVLAMIGGLALELAGPEVILTGALVCLLAAGILTPKEALAGFSNEGMIAVAALFVIAAAMQRTGALEVVSRRVFGRARAEKAALLRLMGAVTFLSSFLNNTPVVAMFIPIVTDWCRKHQVSASKLLIPLSYTAIFGGLCTLIGTSTNLVVNGLMLAAGQPGLGLFELTWVGLPGAVVGAAYLFFVGRHLLPERKDPLTRHGEARREYIATMRVEADCPLVGRPVEEAGLRHLPGLFLVEIERDEQVIAPVSPRERLAAGDRLVFAGVVSTIADLQNIRGLVPAEERLTGPHQHPERVLCEAVIAPSSPLVGQSIREANFRTVYGAAVVAVHRSGERVQAKIGDITLHPGDTLLLETTPDFSRAWSNSPDFLLISQVPDSTPLRRGKAPLALASFVGMMALVAFGVLPMVTAALGAAVWLVVTRCLAPSEARRSMEWPVLVAIGASFGLSEALKKTGAAAVLARGLLRLPSLWGPRAVLGAVLLATIGLTEVLTNNAAAALVFPLAMATAQQAGLDPRPLAVAVAVAASAGFATPFGYQTHLLVYGPGGYRYTDYVRVGLPLDLLYFLVGLWIIPWHWPLRP